MKQIRRGRLWRASDAGNSEPWRALPFFFPAPASTSLLPSSVPELALVPPPRALEPVPLVVVLLVMVVAVEVVVVVDHSPFFPPPPPALPLPAGPALIGGSLIGWQ